MNARLKTFVQQQLGCTCPDEVFAHVRRIADPAGFEDSPVDSVYAIGGRLLLALSAPGDWHIELRQLRQMMLAGRMLRDGLGLNRFRLVIAADDESAAITLQHIFSTLNDIDDRMHLHVVTRDALPSEELAAATD